MADEQRGLSLLAEAEKKVKSAGSFFGGLFGYDIIARNILTQIAAAFRIRFGLIVELVMILEVKVVRTNNNHGFFTSAVVSVLGCASLKYFS